MPFSGIFFKVRNIIGSGRLGLLLKFHKCKLDDYETLRIYVRFVSNNVKATNASAFFWFSYITIP